MKLIVAVVSPESLGAVQRALVPFGAQLLSVCQVVGGGRDPGYTEMYRGRTVHVRRPLLRLEIAADEESAESVVQEILRSGAAGDSDVLVMQLAGCARTCGEAPRPVAARS